MTSTSRIILLGTIMAAAMVTWPMCSNAQDTAGEGSESVSVPSETLSEAIDMQMDPAVGTAAAALGGIMLGILVLQGVILVVIVASLWKIFSKSGLPGWGALVPIYNGVLYCKAGGKPAWWVVLLLIPGVNIVIYLLASIGLAKNFGKGAGFGVGLTLLSIIFLPILGFGKAQHQEHGAPEEEGAEAAPPQAGKVPAGEPAKGLGVFAVLALLAFLCFAGLLFMQYSEWSYYNATPSLNVQAP